MTEKLEQTIKEQILELPKEMQEVINSYNWVKIAEEIGKAHQLDADEINNFQLETLLVLIGATDPEFYAINIENQVETTKDTAVSMAGEAFQKIFTPINKLITENIKKNLQAKNPNYQQTLDFILSGGDYSVFMERNNDLNTTPDFPQTNTLDNSTKIADIKSKFTI